MKQNAEQKRKKEIEVVRQMILLYCRRKHHTQELCEACADLYAYAKERSEHCPFMEQKSFCSNCKVHCYQTEKRARIRQVMRFSGPRMLLYHPVLAVWHLLSSK